MMKSAYRIRLLKLIRAWTLIIIDDYPFSVYIRV